MNDTVDVSRIIETQKVSGFLIRLILISWVVTFFDAFDMYSIAPLMTFMRAPLHLDPKMIANVFSIGLVGNLIGALGFGYLGDMIGRRPTIIMCTFAFGILTLGMATSGSYETLLVYRLFNGIAIGGMLPLGWALNIEYVPRRFRASVVTVIMIGYSLGVFAGGPTTLFLAPHYGWPAVFVVGGALSIVGALTQFLWLPESVRFLTSHGKRPDQIAKIVRAIAPAEPMPANPRFVLSDETAVLRKFRNCTH